MTNHTDSGVGVRLYMRHPRAKNSHVDVRRQMYPGLIERSSKIPEAPQVQMQMARVLCSVRPRRGLTGIEEVVESG